MTAPDTRATVGDITRCLDLAYPPELAESWDSVGLVCGDPNERAAKVLFAVDATAAVVDEALDWGADLLVAHHPLLLRGVDRVGTDTPKGALIHRLIRGGCALFTAHTNADSADPGVSDALAAALGLRIEGPLAAQSQRSLDKWVVFIPGDDVRAVTNAMFAAGAGQIGDYSECGWSVTGTGQFRPGDAANPAIGSVGELERVTEDRYEMVVPRSRRAQVLAALRSAHPYEEPAFDVYELAEMPAPTGLGRIGRLAEPEPLSVFTQRVGISLPATAWGVRAAGDPDRMIERVAVCGGAGDSFLSLVAKLGVDAYVTADLRHHPADEHLRSGGPALIDVAHWASEFPWCDQAKAVVDREFATAAVETRVSDRRTDPWTLAHG
ncbi:Nif3-like dinuclear metal center hexameric protein [Hoyosella sp. YIM 151337]|uniref:Nif3-like dinuclear metal center hexameric protein n=1 Tax=Hoyosella sp. YIM 151337 TaxID=2992742 RepID=UPI00223652DB|nr:Nif3-like dinuclear metal center hexameric protein [Hoyosella sp. YIM 151337]MCW4355346.1 Nif3-like dinuclear metal center hexameric protein [Hoyosella sp. YIM 151337]